MTLNHSTTNPVEGRPTADAPKPVVGPELVAAVLHRDVLPHNPDGFTFDARTLKCLFTGDEPVDRRLFVVSLKDHCLQCIGLPTLEQLTLWIAARISVLMRPGYYIGGWRKGDMFFLDLSLMVRGYGRAMALGCLNDQETIFHPATGRVIPVRNATGTSRNGQPQSSRKGT